jgi:hypothetical protein
MKNMEGYIKIFGLAIMFCYMLVLIHTFYLAFFNESKQVIVDINRYGEANVEAFVVIPIALTVSVASLILFLKDFKDNDKKKEDV